MSPGLRILAEGLRAAAVLLALPVILVAGAWSAGARLPERHTASASGSINAPPARVWELLTDIAHQGAWRETPMVLYRDPSDFSANGPCWYEAWLLTKTRLCATDTGQTRRVVRTAGPFYPFVATWTFELAPAAGDRTILRVTQESTVERPLWRFLGRYVMRKRTAVRYYVETIQREAARRP